MRGVRRTEDWHPAARNPFVPLEGAAVRIKAGHNRGRPKNLTLSLSGAVSAWRAGRCFLKKKKRQGGGVSVCFTGFNVNIYLISVSRATYRA